MDEKLQKSVDDSLKAMSDLIKSKKDDKETVRELLKNPEHREMVRNMMKEYAKGEESESEEESVEEPSSASSEGASKSESESESESEEEKMEGEAKEESKAESKGEKSDSEVEGKKKKGLFGKKKLKKSFDEFEKASEGIIDAVPVLKSIAGLLADAVEEISFLKSEITDLRASQDKSVEMQKSFAGVLESEVTLVKSLTAENETLGKKPQPIKGHVGNKGDLLEKSFTDEKGETKTYSIPEVKAVLMKSFQENTLSSSSISKWEMSNYNMNVFSPTELAIINRGLK